MHHKTTCDTLGDLGQGAAREIINAAIRLAVADIDDRGEDKKPRKVVIEMTMERLDNGLIDTTLTAIAKVPVYRTNSTIARISKRPGKEPSLDFNDMAGDDPDQRTIDEVELEEE